MEELVGSKYYDLSDWFKFTVSSASTVTLLAASKHVDELEVEVCNSSGDTLYTMDSFVVTDGGNRVLALQETLTAGTYYLYVSGGVWETMSLLYDEYLLYLTIEPCTHRNVTGVVTAPTCTEEGYATYTCVCGYRYRDDYTPAKGHTPQILSEKKATCTETGLTEGKYCSDCGVTLTAQSSIPALGHAYAYGICTCCGEEDPGYGVLSGVIRIAGDDRIATSLMLAAQLKEVLGVEKFDAVVVASALNFPDALTGSYLAAEKNAPILLTYPAAHAKNFPDGLCGGPLAYALGAPLILTDSGAPGTADGYVRNITSGIVVGGAGLISDAATRDIFDLAANAHISTK